MLSGPTWRHKPHPAHNPQKKGKGEEKEEGQTSHKKDEAGICSEGTGGFLIKLDLVL